MQSLCKPLYHAIELYSSFTLCPHPYPHCTTPTHSYPVGTSSLLYSSRKKLKHSVSAAHYKMSVRLRKQNFVIITHCNWIDPQHSSKYYS